jgi:transposase
MEACRLGAYRKAHRASDERRHVRAQLAVREALVRTRTRYTAIIKSLARRDGLRVRGSAAHLLQEKIAALDPAPQLLEELQPLFAMLVPLVQQIDIADDRISALERTDPAVALLMTAPAIGAVTASAVVAVADDITRFDSAHQFAAFLGLVPGELSSGDKRHIGHITKAGNSRVRYLLVEAAWRLMRSKQADSAALRAWAIGIANRRGKRIAAVALARRLAGILYAMWRDQKPFDATGIRMPRPRTVART